MMAASKHILIKLDRSGHSSLTYVHKKDDRRGDVTLQLHSSCSEPIKSELLYLANPMVSLFMLYRPGCSQAPLSLPS